MSISLLRVTSMDEVQWLIEAFRARANHAAVTKLDILMDVERLDDPRIVPFLLQVLRDPKETAEVRIHVLKRLRNGRLGLESREPVAHAITQVLSETSSPDLRLQAALALAEFTDIAGIPALLGCLALDSIEPLELRYSAFTSLERAGASPECVALLRQMSADETL